MTSLFSVLFSDWDLDLFVLLFVTICHVVIDKYRKLVINRGMEELGF